MATELSHKSASKDTSSDGSKTGLRTALSNAPMPGLAVSAMQRNLGNRAVSRLLQPPGKRGRRPWGVHADAASANEPRAASVKDHLPGGRKLDEATRRLMESHFGESFSEVRIHTGERAADAAGTLHARAFTVGEDIVFGEGQFAPETPEGRRLLAHELTHVVQQRQLAGPIAGETETERDAHDAAGEVASGGAPEVRQRAAPGKVQKNGEDGHILPAGTNEHIGAPDVVSVQGNLMVQLASNDGGQPDVASVSAWEWGPNNENLRITITARKPTSYQMMGAGRWKSVDVRIQQQFSPMLSPKPTPPVPKPKPKPQPKPAPKPAPKPKQEAPPKPDAEPPVQVVAEVVITADGSDAESDAEPGADAPAPAVPGPDARPVGEQALVALQDDPAKSASLAPQLTDRDLQQFTAKDRADLLGALATNGAGGLDTQSVVRVLQTAGPAQQKALLDALVAHDGKLLADLRASASPEGRGALEGALFQLKLAVDLRAGMAGVSPNVFDPLGARGFKPLVPLGRADPWLRDLQLRTEPNGDWTLQGPGRPPFKIEGALTSATRAERQNERIESAEARQLSPEAKVGRIKELSENLWTGEGDEERIINILRHTPADEAAKVLNGLKTAKSGGQPLLDKLDSAVDLDNNVEFHAQLTALRLRARKDDPKLLSDLAKAPVLPWRDAFFHNRAVFNVRTLSDGRVAVRYGTLQSLELEASGAFGASMRALPKEMQHGGTLVLKPDDIVIVNDTDGNRQVPLTAADLVAFQHSGNRGLLKHIGSVASVAVPVGLAARGTIGLGQAAFEVGSAALAITSDEYRLEITKWSPGLMRAIDIANVAMAIKGGIDLTRLGASGAGAIYSQLKKEYSAFKAAQAAKMAASGEAAAIRAAQIVDAQAQSLLRELEAIQSAGGASGNAGKGPLIVDLQGGPMVSETGPSFLVAQVGETPGAAGVAIEPGDFKLSYRGIDPTGKKDLNFSRMLIQNMPEWPGVNEAGAWPTWKFDPNAAFPKSGEVRVLQGAAGKGLTPVPEAFFPPVSKTPGRVLPENLKDVAGLSPTTHPELHGKVDQIYWRRPFGLGTADPATVSALAKEVDQMLKPGGFIEFRVLPSKDATRALEVAKQIPGARVVEVPQRAIKSYNITGIRPSGLSDEQWAILEPALRDIRGQQGALGEGVFNRIVRVYKPSP
jgi:hypothetical protein